MDFNDILQQFDPISLKELGSYKLLNRVDTKYVCHRSQLINLLEKATEYYKIQATNDLRLFEYNSLYFDTPEIKTYFDHHQGRRKRYKVRFRQYVNTGDAFLELKQKVNYSRTDKKRIATKFASEMNGDHKDFIKNYINFPNKGLYPTIETAFSRITLAGINHLERLTIDLNIAFCDEKRKLELPELVIVEAKRTKAESISPFGKIMREAQIRPLRISKYVIGTVMLNPCIKHNRFKNKVKTVNQINHG